MTSEQPGPAGQGAQPVIVSVDVEDWYHGPSVAARYDARQTLAAALAATPDPERGWRYLEPVLELLGRHAIRATFFWVAEYAQRFPELLKRTAAAGHEIACHGLTHVPKFDPATQRPNFTPNEFKTRTAAARKILEDIGGRPVTGYRAPNAGWMLDALEELGFQYDSSVSVNSIYNKTDSRLEGVDSRPYFPARGELRRGAEPRGLIEFPWPYWQWGGLKIQSAGGPYLRFFGSRLIMAGLRQSLRRGPAVFYFHPVDMCREPIPLPFSWKRPMLWLFKGDLVRRRVEHVLGAVAPCAVNFRTIVEHTRQELLQAGATGIPPVPRP
ncbi:MAG: polysaccharide deacetylase family protein [Kiritimatiellaeota bacterium]|nr:polysaccharide deacetylase family protein [Kiritimatiellota bacterium]